MIIGAVINWGLNFGIAWFMMDGKSQVGLWNTPKTENAYDGGVIFTDILLTVFFITWGTGLIGVGGARDNVKKGKEIPVTAQSLSKGIWAYFPLTNRSFCLRALYIGIMYLALLGGLTLSIFAITCEAGAWNYDPDSTSGATCQWEAKSYIIFKGFYAALVSISVCPIVYLSALNRRNLPEQVYEQFVQRVRLSEDVA